jgi:hypothetical protein
MSRILNAAARWIFPILPPSAQIALAQFMMDYHERRIAALNTEIAALHRQRDAILHPT